MVTKIRVKDLAAELGIGTKDIMQRLRDLDIQAKSHMSTLEDEEVAKVRESFANAKATTEVVKREVHPGVIVRRRTVVRKTRAEEAAEEVHETESREPEESKAEPAAAPEAPAVAAPEPQAAPSRPVTARIIQEPAQAEAAPQPGPVEPEVQVAAPSQPEPEAEPEASAAATPEPETAVEAAPEAQAVPEAQAAPAEAADESADGAPKKKKKKKKREVIIEPPQVRIISRPEAQERPAPPADRPRESQPREQRPGGERYGDRPAGGDRYGDRRPSGPGAPGGYNRPSGPGAPGGYNRPSGPGGPGGYNRPSGPGGPGGYNRPSGPGGPGRPGGFGGPGRPGGFGGAPAGPLPTDDDKKRKKDRRVVDFPSTSTREDEEAKRLRKGKPMIGVAQEELDENLPSRLRGPRRKKSKPHKVEAQTTQPIKAAKRKIRLDEAVRLSDMAHQMGVKAQEIIKVLLGMGVIATINQALDYDTAVLVATEFEYEVENVSFDETALLAGGLDEPEMLKPRPPVVTIMGHVDHGKTSLLDAIRKSSVATGEAGGITQHIGAYHVTTDRGHIVFLDTPGHEAFTTMRARGAKVTDIVVLVVAADDGVMDQTREAINHARAAGVPIVVAVNKIDKPGADADRVKRELSELGLMPEEWGGEAIYSYVSAKQRLGLDELLENILLQAEVLELKANPDKSAKGHIVEARLDKGRGPIATVLISEGTLKVNDHFVCGLFNGKVRAMFDDQGKKIKEAGPSMPVEVQGFDGLPEAGDEFLAVTDEKLARRIAESRQAKQREKDMVGKSKVTLESFLASKAGAEAKSLNLVLKADVQGSLEAIAEALRKLSTDEVKISIIHGGAGAITESDILLASASQAIIIGFNVRPTAKVKNIADQENVEIRFYDIIYKLVDEIKAAMSGMLSPSIEEVYLGQAEVRQTFSVPKVGTVAGCGVVDGKLTRNAKIRLLREGVVIYTGRLSSLKRFKDDAKEVAKGYECGVGLENYNDIKVGDFIEAFEEKEVARSL